MANYSDYITGQMSGKILSIHLSVYEEFVITLKMLIL